MIKDNIGEFWNWFGSVSNELRQNLDNPSILRVLDERVLSFGDLTWEVGPGITEPSFLAISPNGRKELLPTTNAIVALAPNCPGWEFLPAKPPRNWDLRFIIEDDQGQPVDVDANGWQYVLLKFPDGSFDIVVRVQDLQGDGDFKYRAADVAVEGQLGEEVMLQHIQNLDVVSEFESDLVSKSNNIADLANHFSSLVEQ